MLIVVSDTHVGQGSAYGRLADQQKAWESICITAAELGADVIHGGDVFHARKASPQDMRAFQSGLDILREGGRTLLIAAGNHDVQSNDAPTSAEAACAGYDAHVLRIADVVETIDGPVGFLPWGVAAGSASETAAALMVQAEALAERGARMLVAHWALGAASLPSGLPILDLAEPVLDSYFLAQLFEVTLVGHIHKRQTVCTDGLVAHIGPLTRGSFGEAGIETGGFSVNRIGIASDPQSFLEATPFDVADRAYVVIEADVRGSIDATELLLAAIDQREIEGAIVRCQWSQTSEQVVDTVAVLTQIQGQGAHRVDALTPVIERAASVRSAGISELSDPRDAWKAWLKGQEDTADADVLVTANEIAYERIGGAA